jgi:hypothetical protein
MIFYLYGRINCKNHKKDSIGFIIFDFVFFEQNINLF